MPVHMHAEAENRYVGPHWATAPGYMTAKDARRCGVLGEGRTSWTVLFNKDTLRGKGMLRNSVPVKRKERNGIALMSNC